MGADIKNLRTRIKSVKSTLHLTKAMGLVASSKIRKAQLARTRALEYSNSVGSIIDVLSSSSECKKSPYMNEGKSKTDKIIKSSIVRYHIPLKTFIFITVYSFSVFINFTDFTINDYIIP